MPYTLKRSELLLDKRTCDTIHNETGLFHAKKTKPPSLRSIFRPGMLEGFCRKSLRRIDLLEGGVFKGFCCAQAHHGLGLDLDRFARGRIAAHAGLPVRLDGAADSRNYELACAAGFLHGQLEQFVEERDDLLLGDGFFVG